MDALILSCGTGGGHNSACAAMEQALSARGHHVTTLNPYLLRGEKTANAVNSAYNLLAQKAPSAFGVVYRLGNAYRALPVSSPVYQLNRGIAPLMERFLEEHPCDAILCTHLFPAEILTNMKRLGKPVPKTYFIATDYVCIPFTEETDCDYYVIPARELTEEFVARGISRERIVPLGIPVRQEFYDRAPQSEARRRLGLALDQKYILIAGGSIGAGQIEQIVSLLLQHFGDAVRLIVVCGNNHSLYRHLARNYQDRCTLLEYTAQMAEYMRACDLFLSKPGGLSSTEAAVLGAALVHVTPIPGCETRNMEFFSRHGMSLAVTAPKKELLPACEALFGAQERKRLLENQRKTIPPDSSRAICELLESESARSLSRKRESEQ